MITRVKRQEWGELRSVSRVGSEGDGQKRIHWKAIGREVVRCVYVGELRGSEQ